MQVVYLGRSTRRGSLPEPGIDGDAIELFENDWHDFGNKTTFGTSCRINGEEVELGFVKLMVEEQSTSATYLDELRKGGWSGTFPIPKSRYLSVPGEITFYEQIAAFLGLDGAEAVATLLRDASFLVNVKKDEQAIQLLGTSSFRKIAPARAWRSVIVPRRLEAVCPPSDRRDGSRLPL